MAPREVCPSSPYIQFFTPSYIHLMVSLLIQITYMKYLPQWCGQAFAVFSANAAKFKEYLVNQTSLTRLLGYL